MINNNLLGNESFVNSFINGFQKCNSRRLERDGRYKIYVPNIKEAGITHRPPMIYPDEMAGYTASI